MQEQFQVFTPTADGKIRYGYKATDAAMCCRGVQFKLGEWATPVEGGLVPCSNGYHFCLSIAGCLTYYPGPNARVFLVEVDDVADPVKSSGTSAKYVCRNVKFVREVPLTANQRDYGSANVGRCNHGDRNTGDNNSGSRNVGDRNSGDNNTGDNNTGNHNSGDNNTGNYNSGDHNTGDCNTGNHNTGDCNIGNRNIGNRNSGDGNTGNCNTGDYNTGNCNIGNRNTGYYNIGYYNTGNRNIGHYNAGNFNTGYNNIGNCNTGNGNTGSHNSGNGNIGSHNSGDGNTCSGSSGCFCTEEDNFRCFDGPTNMTRAQFFAKHGGTVSALLLKLSEMNCERLNFDTYSDLPNITKEKFDTLIKLHLAKRKPNV